MRGRVSLQMKRNKNASMHVRIYALKLAHDSCQLDKDKALRLGWVQLDLLEQVNIQAHVIHLSPLEITRFPRTIVVIL